MVLTAVRLPEADRDKWFAASRLRGISQSEFLRLALREQSERVLANAVQGRGR